MSRCRSCKAVIEWAMSESTGKPFPVDSEPVEGGTILLRHVEVGRAPHAHVTSAEERAELERQLRNLIGEGVVEERPLRLFVSHFATCPSADQWRKA